MEKEPIDLEESDSDVAPSNGDDDQEDANSDGSMGNNDKGGLTDKDENDEEQELEGHSDDNDSHRVRSACPSPTESLVEHTAALGLRTPPPPQSTFPPEAPGVDVTEIVSNELSVSMKKRRVNRSSRRVGRPKGSKAKQDLRVTSRDGWD